MGRLGGEGVRKGVGKVRGKKLLITFQFPPGSGTSRPSLSGFLNGHSDGGHLEKTRLEKRKVTMVRGSFIFFLKKKKFDRCFGLLEMFVDSILCLKEVFFFVERENARGKGKGEGRRGGQGAFFIMENFRVLLFLFLSLHHFWLFSQEVHIERSFFLEFYFAPCENLAFPFN